jgi:sarcosine oxidase/L-pipecolate oxidase
MNIIRMATLCSNRKYRYTEPFMADLAYKSMSIWKELEMDSGTSLRTMSGLLNFGDTTMGANTPEGYHSRFSTSITQDTKFVSGTLMGPIANLENLSMPFRKSTCLN